MYPPSVVHDLGDHELYSDATTFPPTGMFDYHSDSDSSNEEHNIMDEVTQALLKHLKISTYACGGTIKVQQPADTATGILNNYGANQESTVEAPLADPVTIRWDSVGSIEKLTLPLSRKGATGPDSSVTRLVAGTQPASFGFQGQDIIDESYRKASKLDTSAFSTNFCPYEAGIIDIIGQALLPRDLGSSQGIRAELYKLNASIRVLNSSILLTNIDLSSSFRLLQGTC
jgi:hypothetical protein